MTARGVQHTLLSHTRSRRAGSSRGYLWIAIGLAIGVPSGVAVFAMLRSPTPPPTTLLEAVTPATVVSIESSATITPAAAVVVPLEVTNIVAEVARSGASADRDRSPKRASKTERPAQDRNARSSEEAPAGVALPTFPERADVQGAISELRRLLHACAGTEHGEVRLNVHVSPSGQVRMAEVRGALEGRAEGSCMARAARTIRLPAFSNERFEFSFPYQF